MPTKRPFLRKPWVPWIFWCLLIVSALISLFHAFENWRGARVWERARATYETDERSLSWETLLPNKLVEDEDNFFAIPLLRDLRAPSSPTADAKRNRLTGPTLDKLTREQRTALSKARDFENGKPID